MLKYVHLTFLLDQRILYACWANTCYRDQKNWREISLLRLRVRVNSRSDTAITTGGIQEAACVKYYAQFRNKIWPNNGITSRSASAGLRWEGRLLTLDRVYVGIMYSSDIISTTHNFIIGTCRSDWSVFEI
jgi:hypothetical protein